MDEPGMSMAGVWACPHCALALERTPAGAVCASGHSFDRARTGHLNLMVGGRLPPTVVAGDDPGSLEARRRFLGAGHYRRIADALAEAVVGAAGSVDGPVLDVGCGEGDYLSRIVTPQRYGLDVSKRAVQMACRLLPDAEFVVASAYRLPVLDASVAVVMSVFAPHPIDEFIRVMRPGGRWVTVTPGPLHLAELRPSLDGPAADKARAREERRAVPPAEAASARRLTFSLDLDTAAADDLVAMTPLRWQTPGGDAGPERHLAPTVDVWVSTSAAT